MNNLGKVLNLIAQNNINPQDVFSLVDRIKSTNLRDEDNLRNLIRDASKIAGKKIDKQAEDKLIKKIMSEGINEDIFDML